MSVTVKIPTIEAGLKFLEDLKQPLIYSAIVMKEKIKRNWNKGRGADGNTFSALTPSYARFKKKQGKAGKATMYLSGLMSNSMHPEMKGKNKVVLTFSDFEMDKARGNYSHRPNMMEVSPKLQEEIVQVFFEQYKKRVKK
jgi:hypothetical protein